MPIQIANKRNAKFIGSFTAVLNLTTDKAPTNPKDRDKDDLTTAIREATLNTINTMVLP